MGFFSFAFPSPQDEEDIPPFITIDGKTKRNRWNIPSCLNNEEKKILIQAKKKAYQLDESCCGCCCIGLDPLIGFLPVIGDFAGVGLSFYLINFMKNTDLIERNKIQIMIREMTLNVVKDVAVGFFPLVGDFIDILYKSNTYNTLIFQRYLVNQAKLRSVVKDNHKVEVITHSPDNYNYNDNRDNRENREKINRVNSENYDDRNNRNIEMAKIRKERTGFF